MEANQPIKDTPHRIIWNSKSGKLINDNRLITGLGVIGSTVAMAGGISQSDTFWQLTKNGIIPISGAGLAALGTLAAHDAIVNDFSLRTPTAIRNICLSGLTTLAGAQLIGMSYEIPVLDEALTTTLLTLTDNINILAGLALIYSAYSSAQYALKQMNEITVDDQRFTEKSIKAFAAGATSTTTLLGGVELISRRLNVELGKKALTGTIEHLINSRSMTGLFGTALTGGAAASMLRAIQNLTNSNNSIANAEGVSDLCEPENRKSSNEFANAALITGSTAAGIAGLELMGRAADIETSENLLLNNIHWVKGLAITSTGSAWCKNIYDRYMKNGLSGKQGIESAFALAALPVGASIALEKLDQEIGKQLDTGAEAVFAVGLGVAAAGFGQQTLETFSNEKFEGLFVHPAMSALCSVGALVLLGDAFNYVNLREMGAQLAEHTISPFMNDVLFPLGEFLFDHPVTGGISVIAGVGAVLTLRAQSQPDVAD